MKIEINLQEDLPFFNVSNEKDLILFLLSKELHVTKLVSEYDRVGVANPIFSTDFGTLIMSLSGFPEITDQISDWYCQTLISYADRVQLWDNTITQELAEEFYEEIVGKRDMSLSEAA